MNHRLKLLCCRPFPLLADEHISACAWRGWSPSSPWNQTAPGTPRWGCSTRPRHISRCGSLYSRSTVPSWHYEATRSLNFFALAQCDDVSILAAASLTCCRWSANVAQTMSHDGRYHSSLWRLGSTFHRISQAFDLPALKYHKDGLLRCRMNWKCSKAFILQHLFSLTPLSVWLLAPLSSRSFEKVADSRLEETRWLFFRSQAGEESGPRWRHWGREYWNTISRERL